MVRFRSVESRKDLTGQWILVGGWLAITVIGLLLTPSLNGHGTHRQLGLPPCAAVALLGRPCPGCGMTTSWTATLHGQWQVAVSAHPLGPWSYFAFTGMAAVAGYGVARKLAVHMTRTSNYLLIGAVVLYVFFGLWRFGNPPSRYTLKPMLPYSSSTSTESGVGKDNR